MTVEKVLTISIAAYNVENYLTETLESLICPCIDSLDIIVVNDGSSDATSSIAHSFSQKHPDSIRVIDKPNGGYGSTHNASLLNARGKYFRYVDGDDWYDRDALDKYVSLLATCEADAVITPYVRVFTEEANREVIVDDVTCFPEATYRTADVVLPKPVAACAIAYKTELLRSMDFVMSEKLFYTDIEYAYLPWTHVDTFMVSKLPLYRYRLGHGGQSVSREGISAHYGDICTVMTKLLARCYDTDSGECSSKQYVERCLVKEAVVVYGYLCTAYPNKQVAKKLEEWDCLLKRYPTVSNAAERQSNLVKFLRLTRLRGYRFAAWLKGRRLG